ARCGVCLKAIDGAREAALHLAARLAIEQGARGEAVAAHAQLLRLLEQRIDLAVARELRQARSRLRHLAEVIEDIADARARASTGGAAGRLAPVSGDCSG